MTLRPDPEEYEMGALRLAANFSEARVLEVGCGDGRLMSRYWGDCSSVVGFDLSDGSLRAAAGRVDRETLGSSWILKCAAEDLPFRKHVFDIALLGWSL